MSFRILLEIVLRIMGFWLLLTAIPDLTTTSSFFLTALWGPQPNLPNFVLGSVAGIVARLVVGAVLVFWSPAIAARFYPEDSESPELEVAIGPGDVYRTACFVLGAYLLVSIAPPVGRLLSAAFRGTPLSGSMAGSLAGDLVTAVVYASVGLLLVFGSRRIADMLANLRYDPDTIPRQQLSLACY